MNTTTPRYLLPLLAVAWLLVCFPAPATAGSCKADIRRNNIISNALFTTLFRSVNGELNSWADLGESLLYGGTAGYLFYKSRETIGMGDESRGLALAYLASSVTENTTYGEHPLAHLRYGIGPAEARWSTPFARTGPRLGFALNSFDLVGTLATAFSGKANDFSLRNGVLVGRDQGFTGDDYSASAVGRTVVLKEEFEHDQGLWHHELIHTTQYLQYSSFGSRGLNSFDFGKGTWQQDSESPLSVRVEWFNSLINAIDETRSYEDRWMEIEAARLGQDTSPMHDHNDDTCGAQLGFQFRF